MNNLEENIDLIERYLDNRLSAEELTEFEQRKIDDKKFNELVTEMNTLVQGIRFSEREKLRKELADLEAGLPEVETEVEAKTEKSKVIFLKRRVFQMAVAASIVIAFGLFYVLRPTALSGDDIFNEFYKPYPNIIHGVERSVIPELTLEQKAYYNYEAGNYQEAIALFDEFLQENSNDNYARFYKAVSYMGLGDYVQTIPQLEVLIAEDIELINQAQWYLGLALVKTEQNEKATEVLTKLSQSTSSYASKAQQVLYKLTK
ncbi:MAG: hypothetical protein MI922_25375 [Bacteroidales bacterium]|nr:hypothetical protein [Bacteroidales bacterium]